MKQWELPHKCYFGSAFKKSIDVQFTTLAEYRTKICNNLS